MNEYSKYGWTDVGVLAGANQDPAGAVRDDAFRLGGKPRLGHSAVRASWEGDKTIPNDWPSAAELGKAQKPPVSAAEILKSSRDIADGDQSVLRVGRREGDDFARTYVNPRFAGTLAAAHAARISAQSTASECSPAASESAWVFDGPLTEEPHAEAEAREPLSPLLIGVEEDEHGPKRTFYYPDAPEGLREITYAGVFPADYIPSPEPAPAQA